MASQPRLNASAANGSATKQQPRPFLSPPIGGSAHLGAQRNGNLSGAREYALEIPVVGGDPAEAPAAGIGERLEFGDHCLVDHHAAGSIGEEAAPLERDWRAAIRSDRDNVQGKACSRSFAGCLSGIGVFESVAEQRGSCRAPNRPVGATPAPWQSPLRADCPAPARCRCQCCPVVPRWYPNPPSGG